MARYRELSRAPNYRVGDDGSVWTRYVERSRLHRIGEWRQLTPHRNDEDKHLFVRLWIGAKWVKHYVHRLVLEAFVGPCPDGMEGCHDPDHNPANNCLGNLRWATRQQNCADTVRHGHAHRGDRHVYAKVLERDIPEILSIRLEYPDVKHWEIGVLFGVRADTIRAVLNGSNWNWMTGLRGRDYRDSEQVSLAYAEALRKLKSVGQGGGSHDDLERTEAGARG